MKSKKLWAKIVLTLTGTLSVLGLAATVISCRSTTSSASEYDKSYVYKFESDPYSGRKSDDKLVAWMPWEIIGPSTKDGVITPANSGYVISEWLKQIFPNIEVLDIKANSRITYGDAAPLIDSYIRSGNTEQIPDIIVNYPDIGATLERYKLLQSLGDISGIVAPALQSESRLVFSNTGSNFLLPFSKSTELTYFDVPLFAKILADIANIKNPNAELTVPNNSAQHRMIKMILANQTPYTNIYKMETAGLSKFLWSSLKAAWESKTALNGIWEKDKIKIDLNYTLQKNKQDNLLQIDFSKEIFTSFDEIRIFINILTQAYKLRTESAKASSAYFLAIESPTNEVYSYQYDKAGHSEETFFMSRSTTRSEPSLKFNFGSNESGAAFRDGYTWLQDLINTGATVIKSLAIPIYPTEFLRDHRTLLGLTSSSGSSRASDSNSKNAQFVNETDVYYDLQPTKASLKEKKHSIINQGPGLLITKIHGEEKGQEIARKIKDYFSQTGATVVNNKDVGYWTATGYLYGNAKSYNPNDYVSFLENSISSSVGWRNNIAKYILSDFYNKAEKDPVQYDLFTNPTSPKTQVMRVSIDNFVTANYAAFPGNLMPNSLKMVTDLVKTWLSDKVFLEE